MTDNRTTELRAKLTERGVEYETNDHMGAYETTWSGFTAYQLTPTAKLIMHPTPEQAIAVTLGSEREKALEKMVQKALDECWCDEWWYEDARKLGMEANY